MLKTGQRVGFACWLQDFSFKKGLFLRFSLLLIVRQRKAACCVGLSAGYLGFASRRW
ncbi:hypothetical protein [Polaromonas sp. CG9_12]|nr:hypothetical protein [Polaromonas sp. CG9_12]